MDFEALATSATGWPWCVSGGPQKEGSARWWWGPADRVPVMKALCTVVVAEPPFSNSDSARLFMAPQQL
jgi:hypothetical protein